MPETETVQLIRQAARELELESLSIVPSTDQPGFYTVTWEPKTASIPMGADFKGIIAALKAQLPSD